MDGLFCALCFLRLVNRRGMIILKVLCVLIAISILECGYSNTVKLELVIFSAFLELCLLNGMARTK